MLLPGGEALWRRVAEFAGLRGGQDLLAVGSLPADPLCFFAEEYGVDVMGVDPDPSNIRSAEERIRDRHLAERVQFQAASSNDLPFRDNAFDVVIGGPRLAAAAEPATATAELIRVARVGATVVLAQWTWTADSSLAQQELVAGALGKHLREPAEWLRDLRGAGIQALVVEEIPDVEVPASAGDLGSPAPGLRAGPRALWRRRAALRLVSSRRLLALSLIKGNKWPS